METDDNDLEEFTFVPHPNTMTANQTWVMGEIKGLNWLACPSGEGIDNALSATSQFSDRQIEVAFVKQAGTSYYNVNTCRSC